MSLRAISFSIPSTSELKVVFSDTLSSSITTANFKVESLNGAGSDLEIKKVTIEDNVVTIKTSIMFSGNYYLLHFLDTSVVFASAKGHAIPFDSNSRALFFVGIDDVNPIRDRMLSAVPSVFEVDGTTIKNVLSAQAEELYKAQKAIGKVLSNNYLSIEVKDELRTRTAGAVDRLANENTYSISRVAKNLTGEIAKQNTIYYSDDNVNTRNQSMPYYPVSLQEEILTEEISVNTEGNKFERLILTLSKNVIKLLSVTHIPYDQVENCYGELGTEYDIKRYKYSLSNNYYDQDYGLSNSTLDENQISLSEFGNVSIPDVLDKFIVTYCYKDLSKNILSDIEVSRVESIQRENVPASITTFFLNHAPIVDANNDLGSIGDVSFYLAYEPDADNDYFKKELKFNFSQLPKNLGEYSVNYETGQVFVVGANSIGEGTGKNNFLADYNYRKVFKENIDYVVSNQDIVALPERGLINDQVEIKYTYESVYVPGVDYLAKTHIEVMPEKVENRLSQNFAIKTKNTPITDVFRILNETTGEIYQTLYHSDTEIKFAGKKSPEIKDVFSELVLFEKIENEDAQVTGELIIPAFSVRITSNFNNNNITFTPGIPAELIDVNSSDYFIRSADEDINIRFFGTPNSNNLITSLSISSTATPPGNLETVTIGPRGFVVELKKNKILNGNLDSIGTSLNSSVIFSDNSIFSNSKYFKDITIAPELEVISGYNKKIVSSESNLLDNLSRLRIPGDYTIDHENGTVYLAVTKTQDYDLGKVYYSWANVVTSNNNIITVNGISKKKNPSYDYSQADSIYYDKTTDINSFEINDLEYSSIYFDNLTQAYDANNNLQLVCSLLEDFTALVPHSISSLNGIYKTVDVFGNDLKSSSQTNRIKELDSSALSTSILSGGSNYYSEKISFSNNIIDFKQYVEKRFYNVSSQLQLSIVDPDASELYQVIKNGEVLFSADLNIDKKTNVKILTTTNNVTDVIVELEALDLSNAVENQDYLIDTDGNRFLITDIDTALSILTVNTPAENNSEVDEPVIDLVGESKIVSRAEVTIEDGVLTITVPDDAGVSDCDLVTVVYLTSWTPDYGTPLVIDYRFGSIYVDYSYLKDILSVWYEYGDNSIDWSISDAIQEGEQYYVTYKYGALRDALRTNFGTLTNIPFFQNFGVSTDREVYRNAIKGVLQSYPKGPTIPSYEELVKSFTDIKPNITEKTFGNWILGRDYLNPGEIETKGVLKFLPAKHSEGLYIGEDNSVTLPAISSIDLNQGTVETWIKPDWNGIDNDADITFDFEHFGREKFKLNSNENPLSNGWSILSSEDVYGGFDTSGNGFRIYNYSNDGYDIDTGENGLLYNLESLNRILNAEFKFEFKLTDFNILDDIATIKFGRFFISDLNKDLGFNLELKHLETLSISDVDNQLLEQYDGPHPLRGCTCATRTTVDNLSTFRDVELEITLNDPMTLSLSDYNIIDNKESLVVVSNGNVYQVTKLYSEDGEVITDITQPIHKIFLSKFPLNNSISALTSAGINAITISGLAKIYVKRLVANIDFENSLDYLNTKKYFAIDFSNVIRVTISKDINSNIVNLHINGTRYQCFYTDFISTEKTSAGVYLIAKDNPVNIWFNKLSGYVDNIFSKENIYIGKDSYSPVRIPFTLNKKDYPKTTIGEPFNDTNSEGIFIWFEEKCADDNKNGDWVLRLRRKQLVLQPVDIVANGDGYKIIYEPVEFNYNLKGTVTTTGDFSAVKRSYKYDDCSETPSNRIFRYCGNEELELGWRLIEESDSTIINTLIDGTSTSRILWGKHGTFNTNVYAGNYQLGPSESDGYITDNYFSTVIPSSGDYSLTVSFKVRESDIDIVNTSIGSFSDVISGNHTGMSILELNDQYNLKLSLAYDTSGTPVVVLLSGNNILDISYYDWLDPSNHELYLTKQDNNIVISINSNALFNISTDDLDATQESNINIYIFDSSLLDVDTFYNNFSGNSIDLNLIEFRSLNVEDGYLEDSDTIISTDSKIEFEFNIDVNDGYGLDGYDEYSTYYTSKIDEISFNADSRRYILDTGISEYSNRISLFKDGKGFLNFRVYDNSLKESNEVRYFNLSKNIKDFKPSELHHVAASWKFNSLEEQDEMHLFLDGEEVPNLLKFGGSIPINLNQKFKDVSKEVLFSTMVNKINFSNIYSASVNATTNVLQANQAIFDSSMIGRTILFEYTDYSSALYGGEFYIKDVVDEYTVNLGTNNNLDLYTFTFSGDVLFKLAPYADNIFTDLRNVRNTITRIDVNNESEEMMGLYYEILNSEVNVVKGDNIDRPKYRVNLTTGVIEFVGLDDECLMQPTIDYSDVEIYIRTFGLNVENCKYKLSLSGSTYHSSGDLENNSVIRTLNKEPINLDDVSIKRVILEPTIIDVDSPDYVSPNKYRQEFTISLSNELGKYLLTTESGYLTKQNRGRLISLRFDTDNVDFCDFEQDIDGYQDGYLEADNTITIYGETTDGVNEETFYIYKNGVVNSTKYFKSIDSISGSLLIIDDTYSDAALIELFETDSITVQNNNGTYAEVYDYKNGYLYLTEAGSDGLSPFELHYGIYQIEYPTYLSIKIPEVGKKLFIGSDMNNENHLNGVIDEFRIISEMSLDTRPAENSSVGLRSITDGFNRVNEFCPDSDTLTLIKFNDPIDYQANALRKYKFLDTDLNLVYTLDTDKQDQLLQYVNDEKNFIKKMLNFGYSLEESNKVFAQVHYANGPVNNDANYYKNYITFPRNESSVNELFNNSGNFTRGNGLYVRNNDGKFRKNLGTVEFWVSPIIDTIIDKQERYYLDLYAARRERVSSKTPLIIELPNAARKILGINLLTKRNMDKNFYADSEIILFDEITKNEINEKLGGGSGSLKDFSVNHKLSPDGTTITLSNSLPDYNTDVIVTYLPMSSSGNRFSIYKNQDSQLVFSITSDEGNNTVSVDIDWKKNTWHRIMCQYRTNSSKDFMRLFVDGSEGSNFVYDAGPLYGECYVYGQQDLSESSAEGNFNITINDDFEYMAIGSDVFGDNTARSRMDNMRFSRTLRHTVLNASGEYIDTLYSSNDNTASPVVFDNETTYLLDFDEDVELVSNFAVIKDPVRGIYDFDIDVIDSFGKIDSVEVQDLIQELVNKIKPAHTNAYINFKRTGC